jgi:hypothetical protein
MTDSGSTETPGDRLVSPLVVHEGVADLLAWAVSRWQAEVGSRPMTNVHRRTLDDTWRQVIQRLGGDDLALVGSTHDEILSAG